jgi:hypothetical protein
MLLPSTENKNKNESRKLLLNACIYPNGLQFLAFDTPDVVSSDSILACKNVAARKFADEYRSYAIIRGYEPWNDKKSCLN